MSASPRDTNARSLTPTTDPDAIGTFWDEMTEPGQVYEMRILRKETDQYGKKLIDSAYFTDRHAFVAAAQRIHPTYAAGVYLTMNPVDPNAPTLALKKDGTRRRPFNKGATRAYKGDTTPDEHILSRRHLLIDIDAANGPDESATDDERAAALARRDDIHTYLREVMGWGSAHVITSSGNGGGLIFVIDLPNDDLARDLIKRALRALDARFSTPTATVDVANSNASRITRVAGTATAKGMHTPERPWRAATAEYPRGSIISRAQLEALAATLPPKTRAARPNGATTTGLGDDERNSYADLLANGSPAGQRHHDMTRLVGHYLALGIAPAEVKILLRPWVDRCTPSFPYEELDTTVHDLAAAEARKQTRTDAAASDVPELEDAPATMSVAKLRELVTTQRAQLIDLKAQVKAWEHLSTNRAIPDKAKRVLVHMHKRLNVPLGRAVSTDRPRSIYVDEQNMQAEGFAISAYHQGRDILLDLGLLTRTQVMKKAPEPEPGDDVGERRAGARGKDWFYTYAINGLAVNALWAQLPDLTEIAPTERQLKAKQSREHCLQKAIAEEKPTLHVVQALKRDMEQERKDKEKAAAECLALTFERNTARDALQEAQRIIQDNQRPVGVGTAGRIMCRAGCGSFIAAADWCCDECREREREASEDSVFNVNIESTHHDTHRTVTNLFDVNIESARPPAADDLRPCYECGVTLTPHGLTCKPCRLGERPPSPLRIVTRTQAREGVSV